MAMKRKSDFNNILQNQQKKPNNHKEIGFTNYYVSVPQLESIAIVKVVTVLCRQPDVRDAIMQRSCSPYYRSNYCPIGKTILNKLPLLDIPNIIKAKVPPVINPIVLQIMEWICCLRANIGYDILDSIGYSTLNSLCWTSQGNVDRAKTLKQLIEVNYDSGLLKCEETAQQIYKLACIYCLEDVIPSLWEKLAEKSKVHFLNDSLHENVDDKHLIAYWSSVNNKELSRLSSKIGSVYDIYNWKHSIYKNMFSLSLHQGNILAVKYFWNKLTPEEIICNLEEWISRAITWLNSEIESYSDYQSINEYADILNFLLSKVSAKTQREVIQKNSLVILQSLFLYWPYQRFLLPTIQTMWDSLDEKVYIDLLYTVSEEICEDKTTLNIFRKLWCLSPLNLKHCFIRDIVKPGESSACFALLNVLVVEDMETIKEILTYANNEEERQIVKEIISLPFFRSGLIYADKFNVVDKFFQETSLSGSDIINLKEKVALNFGSDLCWVWFAKNEWEMVEKFFNWAFTSQEKINYFKDIIIDERQKFNITNYYFLKRDNFELVNRFLNWCFCSDQEINEFKKKFALSNPEIVGIGRYDWCLFEKIIAWSSLSAEEMNEFKLNVLQSEMLKKIINDALKEDENSQFLDKLLNWCCHCNEDTKLYKEKCVLTDLFLFTVRHFRNNPELIKKLFSEEVKIKLKNDFAKDRSLKHVLIHLFHLLDDDTELD